MKRLTMIMILILIFTNMSVAQQKEMMQNSTMRAMMMEHMAQNPQIRQQMMRHMMGSMDMDSITIRGNMQMMMNNPRIKQRMQKQHGHDAVHVGWQYESLQNDGDGGRFIHDEKAHDVCR